MTRDYVIEKDLTMTLKARVVEWGSESSIDCNERLLKDFLLESNVI